jgi:hypothetical protein
MSVNFTLPPHYSSTYMTEAGDNPQSQSRNKVEEKNACGLDHSQSQE